MTNRTLIIAGSIVAALAAGLFLLWRGDGIPSIGPSPSPSPEHASLSVQQVVGYDPLDRPEAQQHAQTEAQLITELLNSFYDAAFVDPAKWEQGSHPSLATYMTQEAAAALPSNLQALALGDASTSLVRVVPKTQHITKVTFALAGDLSVINAVAEVTFTATGQIEDSDDKAPISHRATYVLVKQPEGYRVMAYTAEIEIRGVRKAAAFGGNVT